MTDIHCAHGVDLQRLRAPDALRSGVDELDAAAHLAALSIERGYTKRGGIRVALEWTVQVGAPEISTSSSPPPTIGATASQCCHI